MMKQHLEGGRSSSEGAYHEAIEAAAFCIQMATADTKARYRGGSSNNNNNPTQGGELRLLPDATFSSHASCSSADSSNDTNGSNSNDGTSASDDVDYSSDIEATSCGVSTSTSINSFDDRDCGTCTAATNGTTATSGNATITAIDVTTISSLSSDSKDESSCSSLSCSGSDIEDEIEFLEQKTSILKRASDAMKREEAYTAFNARSFAQEGLSLVGSSLWVEARAVLDDLRKEGDLEEWNEVTHSHLSLPVRDFANGFLLNDQGTLQMDDLDSPVPAKRIKIDFSSVAVVAAKDLHKSLGVHWSSKKDDSVLQEVPSSCLSIRQPVLCVPSSRHWMTQAMVSQIPALAADPSSTLSRGIFDVYHDPNLGPLVVSPTHIPFKNSTKLEKALDFTTAAQIITMPTPPFAIVHVNKAFCTLSGFSHARVIGTPVEEVIQIVQEIPKASDVSGRHDADTGSSLRGRFLLQLPKGMRRLSTMCEVQVAPISDRSQRTRGMSHVLVTVKPGDPTDEDHGGDTGNIYSTQIHHSSDKDGLSTQRVFGAVG